MAGFDGIDAAKSVIEDEFWYTTVVDEADAEIVKRGFTQAIRDYPIRAFLTDIDFWSEYEGLDKKLVQKINDALFEMVLDGRWTKKEVVIKELTKLGIDERKAETIAKTELNNIANKIREEAYKTYTDANIFKWVIEENACEKCKKVAELSKDGVSINELKNLVKQVGGNMAREWILHPNCRCTFIKVAGKRWWWEKGDVRKYRRYVRDVAEVPEGAILHRGPRGGLWYDTEYVVNLLDEIIELRTKIVNNYDISEGDLKIANDLREMYRPVLGDLKISVEDMLEGLGSEGMTFRTKDIFSLIGKVKTKLNGDYSKLKNISGLRLYFDGVGVLYESVEKLKAELKKIYGNNISFVDYDYIVANKKKDYHRTYRMEIKLVQNGVVYYIELQLLDVNIARLVRLGHKLIFRHIKDIDDKRCKIIKDCLIQWSEYYLGERDELKCDCSDEFVETLLRKYMLSCDSGEVEKRDKKIYVKPEDLGKLPKGLKIYKGEKGGLYYYESDYKAR